MRQVGLPAARRPGDLLGAGNDYRRSTNHRVAGGHCNTDTPESYATYPPWLSVGTRRDSISIRWATALRGFVSLIRWVLPQRLAQPEQG